MSDQNAPALADFDGTPDRTPAISSALRTIATEVEGLNALAQDLEGARAEAFERALQTIARMKGRLVVTGVGKSGHIGAKIAATFASTGTPAFFVHAAEANHGDLGMIGTDDIILAISWSGETVELKGILDYSRRFGITLIALTSRENSALGRAADATLLLPKRVTEACPHGLAPTTSTTLQIAMGDALAVALLEHRSFTPQDFRTYHPGGKLGASLVRVGDIMHSGAELPLVASGSAMSEAIIEMSRKSFGCVAVTTPKGALAGIITDGDLRRHISSDLLAKTVDEVMSVNPKTAHPDMLAMSALETINTSNITSLMVVADARPVGLVHLHDLLRIGVA
ncbi:KpsF/GutQ family sugar-phosphate isomerase [Fulvimarina sp. 2208YS6-2-32]|uniref:KpsF/GutQ family sugar-phosphate isomerase n=1 Tax=Fulvimarina uroteuthidis TaxID=3098149 RepID=A0ABU5I0D9_9HYPH|nr:KpsF/GutQ family sugar-phosphate isomerase [Fulvimarina sp. 2208YS6-2-32]MDY8108438.1 KpsF/GutQ family sugar-phosphate isomerase [Fulvimarina sp. 2208YS6-2-32]